jgi:GTP cyclohydrolase II
MGRNLMNDFVVHRQVAARIPTRYGTFQLVLFTTNHDRKEHMALIMGEVTGDENVLARVHSECFTGDVLGSVRCDCGEQLDRAMQMIAEAGQGVILYLRQEGRGIGLPDKLRAYNLQDEGLDTVEANLRLGHQADERDYTVAAHMFKELGIRSVNLITNNPTKITELRKLGTVVGQRTPIEVAPGPENLTYLRTKAVRMDHLLQLSSHY